MDKQPEFRTLRSWVLESLSEQILNAALLPGHQLVESELAKNMGISRSPIREALRQLEQEGLVITLPNSSTTVAPIRPDDVEQVFELRELLEPEIVAKAAEREDVVGVEECRKLLEQMRTMVTEGDTIGFAKTDIDFHLALWMMGKRPKMSQVLLRLSRETRRYIAFTSRSLPEGALFTSQSDHERILAAVGAGRTREAAEEMRLHLATSRVRIVNHVTSTQKAMEFPDGRAETVPESARSEQN